MINPLTHRKILKKGAPGRATIIAASLPNAEATSFNMAMTLQVFVEGFAPYEVEDQWMVKAKNTEALSGSIPVKVDREDQQKVAIDWDTLRDEFEAAKTARRNALAAQGPVGGPNEAAAPVVDMRNDPVLRAKLEAVLGYELTPGTSIQVGDPQLQIQIMQVINDHHAEQATNVAASPGSAPASAPDGDDLLSQLERLTALRDGGALTPEEFEQQKRRLLAP